MAESKTNLYPVMLGTIVAIIAAGIAIQGARETAEGFLRLQVHPARLINDFTVVGGTGGALVNCGLVGAVGLFVTWVLRVRLSGPNVAAVLTMMGFGLFGKTPLNVTPIILGVFLASRIVNKPLKAYVLVALSGTAMGPLVTYLVFEAGLAGPPAILVGMIAGVATGVCLTPIAISMLHFHQGYNLYNVGLSCGFFGLFAASVLVAAGTPLPIKVLWNDNPDLLLTWLVPCLSACYILWGIVSGGRRAVADTLAVQALPGRLPSDFMDMVSPSGAFINAGMLGLAGSAYVHLVGGVFSGPAIGGLLTIMGFGAFGKNLKNTWPVVLGVAAACLVFGKDLAAPGPLLAALFGTTLAPLAGQFGPALGVLAGFLHLTIVERTAAWHGGLDLYNNGIAGGLTAAFLVAVIEWLRYNRQRL